MALPNFFDCSLISGQLDSLLSNLGSSVGTISGMINDISKEVSLSSSLGNLSSSSDEIDEAANSVAEAATNIPDYTTPGNNSEGAADQFKEDTEEFQKLMEHCKAVLLPGTLASTGISSALSSLGLNLPDIPEVDRPNFDSGGIKTAITSIINEGKISEENLNNRKREMKRRLMIEFVGVTNFLKEFQIGSKIDDADQSLSEGLTPSISQIKSLSKCAELLGCSDVSDKIDQVNKTLRSLKGKTDPEMEEINNETKDRPTPKYRVRNEGVFVNCTNQERQNLEKARESMSNASKEGSKKFNKINPRRKHRATTIV